ncbi:MAG: membrane dipeptidase [Pseudomonadota bacterium]
MYIDALQYVAPSRAVFEDMRAGAVDMVHITVGYHEDLDGVLRNLSAWYTHIEHNSDLLTRATTVADIRAAHANGTTAVMFGLQNPLPLGADLGRVQLLYDLGIRFCQLTYNQQSLLGAGCFEDRDSGVTAFGRECIAEMNRVGMVIDLSHAGPHTAAEAVALSTRPVAITHANPKSWHDSPRNVTHDLIAAVTARGGMMGFSLYPHHLAGGSDCDLPQFAQMAADMVARFGPHFGIGSDLCQNQPDSVVNWMRNGHWRKTPVPAAVFPPQPPWFQSNRDFPGLALGFKQAGMSADDIAGLMGQNWMRFLETSWGPLDET